MRELHASVLIAFCLCIGSCNQDSPSLLRSVQVLESEGDYLKAIAQLTNKVREEPTNGLLRYQLGRMYSLIFDWPAAEQEFRKAVELGVVEGGRVALGLGRSLLRQRRYQELVTEVVAVPVFEPEVLVSVLALRGHALLSLDRITEAKQELAAAGKLDNQNVDVGLLKARMKAAGRDPDGAMQIVEGLLAQHPRHADAWIHQANLLAILGRPLEALASFDQALKVDPQHLNALVGRAIVLVQVGRLQEAQRDVETLRSTYPKAPSLGVLRGQIHYWRGEYREALDMAQGTLKTDQENAAAQLLSGMASLMLVGPVQAEYEFSRYQLVHPRNESLRPFMTDLRTEVRQRGSESKALAHAHSDALRKASVQALIGDSYVRVWQHSKVAKWFERGVADDPPDLWLVVKHAQRRFNGEQLGEAVLDLERAFEASDEDRTLSQALVLARLALKDTAKALEAMSEMEKRWPHSARAAMLAGIVLTERNQLTEAERRLDEALQRDPKLITAVVARARLDILAGKLDFARRRFENVLKLDPGNLQALVMYAHLEETTRRRSEAKTLLKRAIAAHPSALEPRVLLVDILRKENARVSALAVVEETLALHADEPIAIEQAAEVRLWIGDQEGGLKALEQLLRVLPRSPAGYFKLAKAQFEAGLRAEAESNLERALGMPADDSRTQALQVFGLFEDRTLDAIETVRKSYEVQRIQGGSRLGRVPGFGSSRGNSLYDALSGAGYR